MGTTYTVKIAVTDDKNEEAASLSQIIQDNLDDINEKMSTYRPDSELSRFNQHTDSSPFPVSPEMLDVFSMARQVSDESEGAFDVTVGPLVDAWGFGPKNNRDQTPTDEELIALQQRVGYQKIQINPATCSLSKSAPDIQCDLSAIAKGYAVDRVAEAIESTGYANYMVEVGGEVRTKGLSDTGHPWRIAIEKPVPDAREPDLIVPMSGLSLASSGDYRNFRPLDGLSHTIDPSTGRPIAHKLAAVSVLHAECAMADAYATAMMAMGPEKGMALAETRNLAAVFYLHREDGGFDRHLSTQFDSMMKTMREKTER